MNLISGRRSAAALGLAVLAALLVPTATSTAWSSADAPTRSTAAQQVMQSTATQQATGVSSKLVKWPRY